MAEESINHSRWQTLFPDTEVHRAPPVAFAVPLFHRGQDQLRHPTTPTPTSTAGTSSCLHSCWNPSLKWLHQKSSAFPCPKELPGPRKSADILKLHVRLHFHITKDTNMPNFLNQVAQFQHHSSLCTGTIRKYFQSQGPCFVQHKTRRQAQTYENRSSTWLN